MSNYILSYDLSGADDAIRADFKHELMKQGWTIWERQSVDDSIRQLPDTTMLIKDKDDISVVASVNASLKNSNIINRGASLSKWVISEYRRVHFESDEPLSQKGGRAGDLLRQTIEDVLLPK